MNTGNVNNPVAYNCDVPALWLAHKKALWGFLYKRVKDQHLADDLLQEVLLKIYHFCRTSSGVRNARSWLFQIAQNTLIDHLRRQAKFSLNEDRLQAVPEEENLAYKEAADFIEPLLGFLPQEYALPLKLADLEGLKQAEVAARLGLSLPAVKSRIQRARKLLKAEFLTCCHIETDHQGNLISFALKRDCQPLQAFNKQLPRKS